VAGSFDKAARAKQQSPPGGERVSGDSKQYFSENRSLAEKRLYQGYRENAEEPSGESAKGVGTGMTEHSIIDDILDGLRVRELIEKYVTQLSHDERTNGKCL
jgi:hypothetical protein